MRPLLFTFCVAALGCVVWAQSDNGALAAKAVEAERQGDFAGAVSAFEQLIHNGADTPELRSNLGIAYFQLHDYSAALRQFRLALATRPDSVPANLFSGLALLKLQRAKQALPYLERAHRAQPKAPEVVLALAEAEVASNEIVRARASYAEATRLDPENSEGWYGLGIMDRVLAERELNTAKRATRPQAATQESHALMNASGNAIARAMQIDPTSVRAHMILGESFRIAEQYDKAVQEYKAATEQQPELAAAWAGLATAYSAAGDDENALEAAKRALALDSDDANTNVTIAATLLRQGDSTKAKPYALRALELQPGLASAHVVAGKIYLAERQPGKALPELQVAAKDDTDGSTYYLLATTLRELGRREEAAVAMQNYKRLHQMHVAPMGK